MKKKLIKYIIILLLTFGINFYLYWPIYKKIPLKNPESKNIDEIVKTLDLPIKEEIKEILNKKIDLPTNRHKLCLKNKNGFYLIHADSKQPLIFYTQDLNQSDFGKEVKLGAMAIKLSYQNNLPEDEIYREFGQPEKCIILDIEKLKNYASSTVEYSYTTINKQEELDLGQEGKISIQRKMTGGYYIETAKSSIYIIARWQYFILTFIGIYSILCFVFREKHLTLIKNKLKELFYRIFKRKIVM
jgi:hypothetical protein